MYVVWKRRALSASRPCERCGDRQPGRFSLIPHLVESSRVGGVPRQTHLARLLAIRSCCRKDDRILQAWLRNVEQSLRACRPPDRSGGLTTAEIQQILHSVREGAARERAKDKGGHQRRESNTTSISSPPSYLVSSLRLLRLDWPCRTDEAKAAFRARAKETHPDLGGNAAEFRAVAEAYSLVSKSL